MFPTPQSIDQMPDELELREQTLPEQADWDAACKRAASLFGLTIPTSRNASNVAKLVEEVQAKAREAREPMVSLVKTLNEKSALVPDWRRQSSASNCTVRAWRCWPALLSAEGAAVVTTLAQASDRDFRRGHAPDLGQGP
jgi:hypothetical protein